jgi:hypothetical protein
MVDPSFQDYFDICEFSIWSFRTFPVSINIYAMQTLIWTKHNSEVHVLKHYSMYSLVPRQLNLKLSLSFYSLSPQKSMLRSHKHFRLHKYFVQIKKIIYVYVYINICICVYIWYIFVYKYETYNFICISLCIGNILLLGSKVWEKTWDYCHIFTFVKESRFIIS